MRFQDRYEAGRLLAGKLGHLKGEGAIVLGLPRGGVPVAFEVARALLAPLDVIVVRKLGVPLESELALGAIGEDGVVVFDRDTIRAAQVGEAELSAIERRERGELERQAGRFRGRGQRLDLQGRTAIVVDDGIATGATARAACEVARAHGAARVALAVPVAPISAIAGLALSTDETICLETPHPFFAVGHWYRDFSQVSDDEVVTLLRLAVEDAPPGSSP